MKSTLLCAGLLLSSIARAQTGAEPAPRYCLLGLGVSSMSGYYTGANKSLEGLRFAPTLYAQGAVSRRVVMQSGVAYQKKTTDRDESNASQRYVQHQVLKSAVVPLLLRVALGPVPRKAQFALLTGLTFRYSDLVNQETYYYTGSALGTFRRKQEEKRLDTFWSVGGGLRYQATPRWAALADVSLNFRLGGEKTQYYEVLPASQLAVGVGYCLGQPVPERLK